jgi:hypothetical protein
MVPPSAYHRPRVLLVIYFKNTDPHPARTFPFGIYVTGWVSFRPGLLSREERMTRCPETSVYNYHTTPPNIPEERRY